MTKQQKTPDTDLKKKLIEEHYEYCCRAECCFDEGINKGEELAKKETAEKVKMLKKMLIYRKADEFLKEYNDNILKIIDKIFKEAEGEKK